MAKSPSDLYGTDGSVPNPVSVDGSGAQMDSTRATPNDFGAQVGGAVENLGQTGEKVSGELGDALIKQQQTINETTMTNADTQTAIAAGKLRADYMSKTGMDAYNSFDQYQASLQNLIDQGKQGLNPMAARGYEMLARRTIASHIIDGSGYAASQLKSANRDAGSSNMGIHVDSAGDPYIANDDQRFGAVLGNIHYNAAMMNGDDNLKTDPDTGSLSFDDTPQGQSSKQQYDSTVNYNIGIAWQNRIQTLAKDDPLNASQVFTANKDNIPPDAAVRIDASLQPQIQNYHASNVVGNTLNEANIAHQQLLLNPSSTGSNAFNLGNVKTPSGAASDTANFVNPATPVDGVALTANTLRKGYQGLTLAQIANKWAPPSENQTNQWVKNVSTVSGINADEVPDLNNPQQLGSLLKGIATAEKSPADRANFSDDVIAQGVQKSLNGEPVATSAQSNKPYATNPDGSPLWQPDYYATHKNQILQAGDRYAEQTMPGDLEFKNIVRQRLTNQMDTAISSQAAQYKEDNNFIQQGISGALTGGKPPATGIGGELSQIPGMQNVLNRSAVHSPQYYQGIDTQINKISSQNNTVNSPNAYDVITRTLLPGDNPNVINTQDKLASLLGRKDFTGINVKDYNDALKSVNLSDGSGKNDTWNQFLLGHMQAISNANGNIDGQGQARAVAFYNSANKIKDDNSSDPNFVSDVQSGKNKIFDGIISSPMYQPSRAQQLANHVQSLPQKQAQTIPTFSSPNDPAFAKLPTGSKFINGVTGKTAVKH